MVCRLKMRYLTENKSGKPSVMLKRVLGVVLITIALACQRNQKSSISVSEASTTKTVPSDTDQTTLEVKAVTKKTFKTVVEGMTEITYALKEFEELTAKDNFLNKRISVVNSYLEHRGQDLEALLDVSKIKTVQRAKVKSSKLLGSNLYPRATLEYWECHTEQDASDLLGRIETIKERGPWDVVSKSPITYFQKDNSLVFITPGGFYMLDLVPEIETFLKERL